MAGEIHRRAAAERFLVERGAGRDVVADVRDVDAEQIVAVLQLFERNGVVEVLRVVAVDGEDELIAQIEPIARGVHIDLLRDGFGLLNDFVREHVVHAVFVQDGGDGGLHRAALAQISLYNALRRDGLVAVVRDRNGHAVADLRVAEVMLVHRDLGVLLRGRLHEIRLAALHQLAGQLLVGALEDADDRRFPAAAVVFALGYLDEHAVAVPRSARCVRRDEQVVRLGLALRVVGRDERERALGREIGARRAAVVRGDRKAVFLVFHHLAVRDQRVERGFGLVFARVGQLAPDVLHAARVLQDFEQFGLEFGVYFFIFHIRPSILRSFGEKSSVAIIIHDKNKP